jgi:hypothetical protein
MLMLLCGCATVRECLLWLHFPQNNVCFPMIGTFFPGATEKFMAHNRRLLEQQDTITALMGQLAQAGHGKAVTDGDVAGTAVLSDYKGAELADQIKAAVDQNRCVAVLAWLRISRGKCMEGLWRGCEEGHYWKRDRCMATG